MRLTPRHLRKTPRYAAASLLSAMVLIALNLTASLADGDGFFSAEQHDRAARAGAFTLKLSKTNTGLDSMSAPRDDAPAASAGTPADLASL